MSPTNRFLGLLCLAASLCLCQANWMTPAHADTIPVKSAELRPEDDSYALEAQFDVSFNATLEEALQKGVSLYFVLEFELVRPRKYWLDERVASQSIQYRISYSPLTQHYRVTSGLLSQQFSSLDEVEHLLSRVASRPVVAADALTKGAHYEAAVRLRLDVTQLPKPFQVNALASKEWSLSSEWYRWSFTP
ncbi:MAG TPA: DUF4390 domain-containing protein [Casimicrobiaceae bacterium]|jgi:hypothetical protein|nr:DUF4390 domain-containing protein [Casimicrobiaceae bacterium]